jgi:hypothetical protein
VGISERQVSIREHLAYFLRSDPMFCDVLLVDVVPFKEIDVAARLALLVLICMILSDIVIQKVPSFNYIAR